MSDKYSNIPEDVKRLMEKLGMDLYDEEGEVDIKSYKIAKLLNEFRKKKDVKGSFASYVGSADTKDAGAYLGGHAVGIAYESVSAGEQVAVAFDGRIGRIKPTSDDRSYIIDTRETPTYTAKLEPTVITFDQVKRLEEMGIEGFNEIDPDIPPEYKVYQIERKISGSGNVLEIEFIDKDGNTIEREYYMTHR